MDNFALQRFHTSDIRKILTKITNNKLKVLNLILFSNLICDILDWYLI